LARVSNQESVTRESKTRSQSSAARHQRQDDS
jgi:hypothetical protein